MHYTVYNALVENERCKIQENILVIGNYVHHVVALLLCGTRSMWIGRSRCVPRTRWVCLRHDHSFAGNSMCLHSTGLIHITIVRLPAPDCQINFHWNDFSAQLYMQWFVIEKKKKENLLHSHWSHNNFYRCHRGNNFFSLSFIHPCKPYRSHTNEWRLDDR